MFYRTGLVMIASALFAGSAMADTKSTSANAVPVPAQTPAAAVKLAVPPPDFTPPHREQLAPLDDIPSSGSSSQYVHGPNEGPVPGSSQYRLGGPPPNAQSLLGD